MNGPVRDDTIELREIVAALSRGRLWIAAGVAFGLALALVVNWIGPRRFEGEASVIVRTQQSGAGGGVPGAGALEGLAEAFSVPGQMSGPLGSAVETETAILDSRWLLERVIGEVGLQVRVKRPRGAGVDSLFARAEVDPRVEEAEYSFRRVDGGFRVEGDDGFQATVAEGGTVEVPGARLTLQPGGLPDRFRVELVDLRDAVSEIELWRRLDVDGEETGDLVYVAYYAQGPRTAERVANTLVELYLEDRRQRTDSLHEERMAILGSVVDSIGRELDAATERLRRFQQRAQVYDPERLGEVQRAVELRSRADGLQVEVRAVERVLDLARTDSLTASDVLALPSFMQNPGVSSLLDRLLSLQQRRRELLERRTAQDPDVLLLEQNIRSLTAELVELARAYRDNLQGQLAQLRRELEDYRERLAERPSVVADSLVLSQDLERIAASYVGTQAQVVQARLDHIGQDADLRQVDRAVPPMKASFPRPILNLAIGGAAGLLMGLAAALAGGFLSRRVDDPRRLQEWTGAHAFRLDPDRPLLAAGTQEAHCVLVVGVMGTSPLSPARRLAEGAALRDGRVALVDLTSHPSARLGPAGGGRRDEDVERVPVEGGAAYERRLPAVVGDEEGVSALRRGIEELEAAYSLVVVALPGPDAPVTISLLRPDRPVLLAVREGMPALDELGHLISGLERAGTPVGAVAVVPATEEASAG